MTARLIVRRVKLLPPAGADQPALVEGHRYHAVFTDSPLTMLQAETCHRGHAIVEQVIADLKNGPLAHLPSGQFAANAAWLTLAAIAHNLTRAAGCLASAFHATARPATLRDQLINVPGPDRQLRPAAHPAPADRLALGTSLAGGNDRRHLTSRPTRPPATKDPQWKHRADRPTRHAQPPQPRTIKINYATPEGWSVDRG